MPRTAEAPLTRRDLLMRISLGVFGTGFVGGAAAGFTSPGLSPEGKDLSVASVQAGHRIDSISRDLSIATQPALRQRLSEEKVLWESQRDEINQKLQVEQAKIQPLVDKYETATKVAVGAIAVGIIGVLASEVGKTEIVKSSAAL